MCRFPPSPIMLFEQTVLQHLFGKRVLQSAPRRAASSPPGWSPHGLCHRQGALARFQKLLRPIVVQALRDTFAATQRGDALLAPKIFQYDADPLFHQCRRRVLRRISPTALSTDAFDCADLFCLICVPCSHCDEPEITTYTIKSICHTGEDAEKADISK